MLEFIAECFGSRIVPVELNGATRDARFGIRLIALDAGAESRKNTRRLYNIVLCIIGIIAGSDLRAFADGEKFKELAGKVLVRVLKRILVIVEETQHRIVGYHFGYQFFKVAQRTPMQQLEVIEKNEIIECIGGRSQVLMPEKCHFVVYARIMERLVEPPGDDVPLEGKILVGCGLARRIDPHDGFHGGGLRVVIYRLFEVEWLGHEQFGHRQIGGLSSQVIYL